MARGVHGSKPPHGTAGRYNNHKCRCGECREAWRIYIRERSWRLGYHRPLDQVLSERRATAEARDNHGTETRYQLGCRCQVCRDGVADARRQRRWADIEATRAYDRERYRRERVTT
jgi:hypothetical protein